MKESTMNPKSDLWNERVLWSIQKWSHKISINCGLIQKESTIDSIKWIIYFFQYSYISQCELFCGELNNQIQDKCKDEGENWLMETF